MSGWRRGETKTAVKQNHGWTIFVCIGSGTARLARVWIRNSVNRAEQSAYAMVTPSASEARMVEIINTIIGGSFGAAT